MADRLFAAQRDEDALFDVVNKIMGCDIHRCLDADFVFAAHDTFWDYYDASVEVILDNASPWMTDEQALQILELGFSQIYASRGGEMENISHQYSSPGVKVPGELKRYLYTEGRASTGTEGNRWRAKYIALRASITGDAHAPLEE